VEMEEESHGGNGGFDSFGATEERARTEVTEDAEGFGCLARRRFCTPRRT
jgi:hypothetical protein